MAYTRPAAAYTCDACVVAAIAAQTLEINADLNTIIMGYPSGVNPGPFLRLIPGEVTGADLLPMAVTPPYSLVGYYENVWWPRMVELSKTQQGAQDKTQTLLNELSARTQQARSYADYTQDVRRMTLGTQTRALGRADVLCPEPSMGQSSLALQFMARQRQRTLEMLSTREMAGDRSLPDFAYGKLEYDKKRIKGRIDSGLCTQNGSAGTASKYCTNTIAALENSDETLSTLMGSQVLDDAANSQSPYSVTAVKRFIDNVFANRVFEPLPQSITAQANLPPDAVQIIADETSFAAAMTTFQSPFLQEQADRSPVDGQVAALSSLEAAADAAGFTGEVRNYLVNNGKISKASEEYIRYKVFEHDPGTINKIVAGPGGASAENLLSFSIQKEMKQITLLYDIREEIKKSNLLLGALGAMLSGPTYQDIRSRIQSIQTSDDNQGQ